MNQLRPQHGVLHIIAIKYSFHYPHPHYPARSIPLVSHSFFLRLLFFSSSLLRNNQTWILIRHPIQADNECKTLDLPESFFFRVNPTISRVRSNSTYL